MLLTNDKSMLNSTPKNAPAGHHRDIFAFLRIICLEWNKEQKLDTSITECYNMITKVKRNFTLHTENPGLDTGVFFCFLVIPSDISLSRDYY